MNILGGKLPEEFEVVTARVLLPDSVVDVGIIQGRPAIRIGIPGEAAMTVAVTPEMADALSEGFDKAAEVAEGGIVGVPIIKDWREIA